MRCIEEDNHTECDKVGNSKRALFHSSEPLTQNNQPRIWRCTPRSVSLSVCLSVCLSVSLKLTEESIHRVNRWQNACDKRKWTSNRISALVFSSSQTSIRDETISAVIVPCSAADESLKTANRFTAVRTTFPGGGWRQRRKTAFSLG